VSAPEPLAKGHQAPAPAIAWLRATRVGLLCLALPVGAGAGLGAVAFRYLIYGCTWLLTGHAQFGQQGHVSSPHLPWLGTWFVVVTPVLGGLVVGPLVHFGAREARGHGVPEVMAAVSEHGGRIRPQVTVVKALASAVCIGTGGSVGREGPIVQIGSALASSVGQAARVSESRLRILVACGAAAGISATFNAPLTGVFFGLELILRDVSLEAFVAVLTASMAAGAVSQAFFGAHAFISGLPAVGFPTPTDYLLCALLGVLGGAVGIGFKTVLYRTEDVCDAIWRRRPEWLRPAAGGAVVGLLFLAMPQLYGVGYPVMQEAVAGGYVLWFVLLLVVAKMVATSLTIGIGGSGGVFAPSLFIGACLGVAYGSVTQHVLGPAAGPVAAYAMVAMGAVFAGAARAPLTSTASVLELTGNFGLVLPVMLSAALASAVSDHLSRGSIYTTKLLRRGIDIERRRRTG
jgi:CIC family chloride channel protein